MTLPSRFVAEARAEYREQILRYKASDPQLAKRFTAAVEKEVRTVSEFPAAGPLYDDPYRQRVLPNPFPYSVVFTVEQGVLVVVAVWAQRRNPGILRARLRHRVPGT